MTKIKINENYVGHECSPFIVAEAGINHNGEIEKALEMIHLAKECGADAVKFQTFKAEEFILDPTITYTYNSQGKEVTESMLEMFKRYELERHDWFKIKKKCDEEKIIFLSTPQNYSDLELLLELGICAIKVGSDDFTNIPLLKKYSETKLPMLISCGMSNLAEIFQSLDALGSLEGYPTILLLTTSQYPTPPNDVNLKKLQTLSKVFPNIPLGFSDHTQGPLASSLAVALGACVFEKHFTLNHNLPGPDHWFSEDPEGLKIWINSIRKSYSMMGTSIVKPTKSEESMKNLARRSIVALCDISRGEIFSENNIGLRRPGNGIPPSLFYKILGKESVKNVNKGKLIQYGDFV